MPTGGAVLWRVWPCGGILAAQCGEDGSRLRLCLDGSATGIGSVFLEQATQAWRNTCRPRLLHREERNHNGAIGCLCCASDCACHLRHLHRKLHSRSLMAQGTVKAMAY